MATGTNAIATEKEAAAIGGIGTPTENNRMCTKNMGLKYNCTVAGTYASNQLVKYSSLSKTGSTGGGGGSSGVGDPFFQPPVRIYSINNTVLERNIGSNYPHHWLDSTQGPVVLDTYITDNTLTANNEHDYWDYRSRSPFCPVKLNSKHIQIVLLTREENIFFCIYGSVYGGSFKGTITKEYNNHTISWDPMHVEDPDGNVSSVSTRRFIDSNNGSLIVFDAYLYNFSLFDHTPYTIDFWSEDSSGMVTRIDFITNDDDVRPRTDQSEYLNYTFGSIQGFYISAIQTDSELKEIDSITLLSQRNARLKNLNDDSILGDVVYYDTFSNYDCHCYVLGLQDNEQGLFTIPGWKEVNGNYHISRYFNDINDIGFSLYFTIEYGSMDYSTLTQTQIVENILSNTIINLGYTNTEESLLTLPNNDIAQTIFDGASDKISFRLYDYLEFCNNEYNITPIQINEPMPYIYNFTVDLLYFCIDHLVGSNFLKLIEQYPDICIVGNLQYLNRVYAFGFDILSNFNIENYKYIDRLIEDEKGLGLYTRYSGADYDNTQNYPSNPEFVTIANVMS